MDSEITSSCEAITQQRKSLSRTQVFSALAIAVTNMGIGTCVAYTSPAIPKLLNPTSPADGPLRLTQNQCDWFASIFNLASAFGGLWCGYSMDHLGRKLTLLVLCGLAIVGWILIAAGPNFATLMTGRSILGIAMGACPFTTVAYIGEIASTDIRGSLTGLSMMTVTLGNLWCYGFGCAIDSWRWQAGVAGVPSAIGFILLFFIKESPLFLLMKHKTKEARITLQHFRGKNCDIKEEFKKTEQFLEELKRYKQASMKDLLLPYNLKPSLIGVVIPSLLQLTGVMPILLNLETIFQDADTGFSNAVSSVIVGSVQAAVAIMVVSVVDKFGRKTLLVISSASASLSLAALASYFYLKEQDSTWARETLGWLPLTALIAFIISINLGLAPLQFLILVLKKTVVTKLTVRKVREASPSRLSPAFNASERHTLTMPSNCELLSPEVKGIAGALATTWVFILTFTISIINDPMQRALSIAGTYWLYSFFTFLGLIFCAFVVPETKGKTMQEIARIFKNPAAGAIPEGKS